MSPSTLSQVDALRNALVWERRDLYRANAAFHNTVNSLAPLIAIWVDAIATESVDSQARIDRWKPATRYVPTVEEDKAFARLLQTDPEKGTPAS